MTELLCPASHHTAPPPKRSLQSRANPTLHLCFLPPFLPIKESQDPCNESRQRLHPSASSSIHWLLNNLLPGTEKTWSQTYTGQRSAPHKTSLKITWCSHHIRISFRAMISTSQNLLENNLVLTSHQNFFPKHLHGTRSADPSLSPGHLCGDNNRHNLSMQPSYCMCLTHEPAFNDVCVLKLVFPAAPPANRVAWGSTRSLSKAGLSR